MSKRIHLHRGCIVVYIGPMFSRKSSELLVELDRWEISGKTVMLIRHEDDTRYASIEGHPVTHSRMCRPAVFCRNLRDALEIDEVKEARVVGIDDAQFFPDLAEVCAELANRGIIVIVAALNGTFEQKPFPAVSNLIPHAEEVHKLFAVCMKCGSHEASFSIRLDKNDRREVAVGGRESYMAVCRACLNPDAGALDVSY